MLTAQPFAQVREAEQRHEPCEDVIAALFVCRSATKTSKDREERGPLARVVRVVKSIFGVQTNSDGLTPPLPAPRP